MKRALAFLSAAAAMWLLDLVRLLLGCPIALVVWIVAKAIDRKFDVAAAAATADYCRRVWTATDQGANALAGGHPDETVSSRAGRSWARAIRARRRPYWLTEFIAKWTNLFDPGHIERSIEESAKVLDDRGHGWR